MTTYNILCSHALHASNSAQPGWDDGVLGTVDLDASVQLPQVNSATSGYICAGCALYEVLLPPEEPPPEPGPTTDPNFMGRPVVGHKLATVFDMGPLPLSAGHKVTTSPVSVKAGMRLGSILTTRTTLTPAPPLLRSGASLKGVTSLVPNLAPHASGARITQTRIALAHESGATTVAQESVTNTGWTSTASAAGKKNGTSAAFAGDALNAKTGRLVLDYADFVNKTPLTITGVFLDFYVSVSGTALNNGDLRCQWRIGAGTINTLETITANVNSLTIPRVFDLTGLLTWTWADLDAVQALVYGETGVAENLIAYACDAVHLRVTAERTDSL